MLLMKTSIVFVFSTLLLAGCQTTPSTKTATAVEKYSKVSKSLKVKKANTDVKLKRQLVHVLVKKSAEVLRKLNMTAKKQKKG